MYRRSNSASHIPVPSTNLFNVKNRSRSSTRSSSSSAVGVTKTTRRSSSESKLSTNRLSRYTPFQQSKITPLNQQKQGRSSSLSKITPSSIQRSGTSSRVCSSSGLRERKTIQKLSTDKKWVSEQHAKVREFIETSGLFDLDIANPDNLKSFSIKSFVYISSVLLGQIFISIDITTENYKELIAAKSKILHYPGTLTNSVLKMVYTTHAWPQIIGFFGWLVDKINIQNLNENLSLSILEPDIKQKYMVTQKCLDLLIQRHFLYNTKTNNEESERKINDKYVKDIKEILEVDEEKYVQLKNEVQKNLESISKQKNDIADLLSNIKEMQKHIDNLTKEIEEYEESDVIQETELDGELKYLQERLKKVKNTRKTLSEKVEKLQDIIKRQPCTHQEKLNLIKKIEDRKREISIKKENIEHGQRIRQEFHTKANKDREALENAAISWNRSLKKWIIKKPQLKCLLLRETSLHQPSFLSEIKEVVKQKNILDQELLQELESVEKKIRNEQSKKVELDTEMETLTNVIEVLKKENANMDEKFVSTQASIKSMKSEFELLKQSYVQNMQALKNHDLENLTQEVEKLKEERDLLEAEVKKFSIKAVSFLIEFREKILNCAKQSETTVNTVKKKLLLEAIQKQNEILAILEEHANRKE